MTIAHLHLMLNHFPIIGTLIGLALFMFALAARSEDLKRFSLGVFLVMALVGVPAYLTGFAAQEAIRDSPGVSAAWIERHQDLGLLALVLMALTGSVAWLGLWQFRRFSRPARWMVPTVLLLAAVTVGVMARTATMGGEIRHPEIRYAPEAPAAGGWNASIASFVVAEPWVWPAAETVHFLGMALLMGVVLVVNLRLLGVAKGVSFAALHRLLPWGVLGFAVNLGTGLLFVIAAPDQYTQNFAMHMKMVLMMIAGVNVLYFTVFDGPWALGPGDDAPLAGKIVAVSTIVLWSGVVYYGRMMPFLGTSF